MSSDDHRGSGGSTTDDNKVVQQPVNFRLLNSRLPQRRYILGTEIALAAVIASAGMARARTQANSKTEAGGNAQADEKTGADRRRQPQPNHANHQEPLSDQPKAFGERGGRRIIDIGRAGQSMVTQYVVSRSVGPNIDAFAVSSKLIQQVRSPERRYIIGTEIALAILIASGGIASLRNDRKPAGDRHEEITNRADEHKTTDNILTHSGPGHSQCDIAQQLHDKLNRAPDLIRAFDLLSRRLAAAPPAVYLASTDPAVLDCFSLIPLDVRVAEIADSPHPAMGESEKRNPTVKRAGPTETANREDAADRESSVVPVLNSRPVLFRPTILVEANDTLVSIAEHHLHDANLGWLIADLNRHNVKESFVDGQRIVELRTRQQLVLPIWQDIEEFYRQPESAYRENLVTIVEESQIDKELLSTVLGPLIASSTIQIETKNASSTRTQTDLDRKPETPPGPHNT